MRLILKTFIFFMVILLSYGCDNGGERMFNDVLGGPINETKALEVRELITSELRVGSTSEEIEAFFRKHEISFSYNKFDKWYTGIIRDVSGNQQVAQDVVIKISVDEQKAFKSFEVYDSFTVL